MNCEDNGDVIIKVAKAWKTFAPDITALRDFSLEVKKGEVVVVIGPSGSGKSTLLRCLNGLEEIDSGQVVIDGLDLWANRKNRR